MAKSIKKLPHTKRVYKKKKKGGSQHYWTGQKKKKPRVKRKQNGWVKTRNNPPEWLFKTPNSWKIISVLYDKNSPYATMKWGVFIQTDKNSFTEPILYRKSKRLALNEARAWIKRHPFNQTKRLPPHLLHMLDKRYAKWDTSGQKPILRVTQKGRNYGVLIEKGWWNPLGFRDPAHSSKKFYAFDTRKKDVIDWGKFEKELAGRKFYNRPKIMVGDDIVTLNGKDYTYGKQEINVTIPPTARRVKTHRDYQIDYITGRYLYTHYEFGQHWLIPMAKGKPKKQFYNKQKASGGSFSTRTILQQLGGKQFIAMTGAKNFVKDDAKRQIGFKIGRNDKNINYVRIRLNQMDTYDMDFINTRTVAPQMTLYTVKSKARGVYNDMLQDVFTEHTGMYTSLFGKQYYNQPDEKAKLLKLIKKYKPSYTMDNLQQLIHTGTHSVFLAVMNESPLTKRARKDADTMQRLFMNTEKKQTPSQRQTSNFARGVASSATLSGLRGKQYYNKPKGQIPLPSVPTIGSIHFDKIRLDRLPNAIHPWKPPKYQVVNGRRDVNSAYYLNRKTKAKIIVGNHIWTRRLMGVAIFAIRVKIHFQGVNEETGEPRIFIDEHYYRDFELNALMRDVNKELVRLMRLYTKNPTKRKKKTSRR